jgi:hypothetical protein
VHFVILFMYLSAKICVHSISEDLRLPVRSVSRRRGECINRKGGKAAQDYFELKIILNFEFAITIKILVSFVGFRALRDPVFCIICGKCI